MRSNFKDLKQIISVADVNKNIKTDTQKYINTCEELYHNQVIAVANHIKDNINKTKVVLLAGPSGSGKTTTSYKISEQLSKYHINSLVVSLDDFFLGAGRFPKLPNGNDDYESVNSLDIERIKSCFIDLLTKGSAIFPVYDFATGTRLEKTNEVSISENAVLILEGIHALNPIILPENAKEGFLKLYVCINSQYGEQGNIILSSRDNRLMRRMIRDYKFRSASPKRTLDMWDDVCAGEDVYIKPFKSEADFIIDSTHRYEPCIYHHELIPLLGKVDVSSEYYHKVKNLCDILEEFTDIDIKYLPENSMLREFMG